ncbi:class I SAM-dependent methyltransferase [Alkalibacillus sp. S2W]|uniref:class I SAM-dependent methyltransferase n=1 Tax=Alkalibacillus sp. S2W TaxID=3386553 RepID=UPI00398CA9EC
MYGFYNSMATEVYDLIHPIGDPYGDLEFYRERLKGVQGKVLMPSVGTGRLMIPLIESGLNVEGMDVSTDWLDLCKDHLEARHLPTRLFQGEMQTLSIDATYDAIILPSGSIHTLSEWDQIMETLTRFYDHLHVDGRLIFDVTFPKTTEVGHVTTYEWETFDGDVITLEDKIIDVSWVNQLIMSHHKYERWHRGQFVEAELERVSFKWFGIEELRLMLAQAGFINISLTADYKEEAPINGETNTITFEAVK